MLLSSSVCVCVSFFYMYLSFSFFVHRGLQRNFSQAASSTVTPGGVNLWSGLQPPTPFIQTSTSTLTLVRPLPLSSGVRCLPVCADAALWFLACSSVGGLHRFPPKGQHPGKDRPRGGRVPSAAGVHLGVTPAVLRARYNLTAADVGAAQNNSQAVAQV